MSVELTIPSVGESITEVQIGEWLKRVGDRVELDEPVVEIESAKVTVELPAPAAGVLTAILKQTGEDAEVGDVIGTIDEAGVATTVAATPADSGVPSQAEPEVQVTKPIPRPAPQEHRPAPQDAPPPSSPSPSSPSNSGDVIVMPSAQRLLHQAGVSADQVTPTGPGGRLLKGDALQAVGPGPLVAPPRPRAAPPPVSPLEPSLPLAGATGPETDSERKEWSVRMTPLRRTIAARLVQTKQETALLTTFNEIDMTEVKGLRSKFGEQFLQVHDIKLGFMSFFVQATVVALERFPGVNGEIRGQEIVYRNYADVGIAVGGGKGLVVPIIRDAQRKSFADLEREISDYGRRATANKLHPEELEGGTFTISNGGVYGSLLSTPIPSPPQSGILGLHAIQDRPVARNGEVVIRPMMYVALSYDHRIVDGKEAVTFLKTIKEQMEQPARMLLEV